MCATDYPSYRKVRNNFLKTFIRELFFHCFFRLRVSVVAVFVHSKNRNQVRGIATLIATQIAIANIG